MSQQRPKATHGFHATMTAHPGKADALIELLLEGEPTTNDDCVLYLVGRSAGNVDVVHVTEGWTSKDAHARNFARPESQALIARIASLVTDGAEYADLVPIGGKCLL